MTLVLSQEWQTHLVVQWFSLYKQLNLLAYKQLLAYFNMSPCFVGFFFPWISTINSLFIREHDLGHECRFAIPVCHGCLIPESHKCSHSDHWMNGSFHITPWHVPRFSLRRQSGFPPPAAQAAADTLEPAAANASEECWCWVKIHSVIPCLYCG